MLHWLLMLMLLATPAAGVCQVSGVLKHTQPEVHIEVSAATTTLHHNLLSILLFCFSLRLCWLHPAGEYYNINLLKSPFKLSQPLEIIDEQTQDGKHMLLFDVQKMVWEDPLDGLV